ncbi:MAG TPA: TetR/AcrR family transcriptional regulator [Acidimicrobiales bacterium]|nr:TetR/AcrR family transcriptional regulator [Acidimicrobiales bacterium]
MVKSGSEDTRDRLIDATLDLVAAHGFDGVSVGDIEAGAGLAPRSGALYKYFDSKLAVLEAGLERHLASVAGMGDDLATSALVDASAEVDFIARMLLAELDRERTITHVIEREGDRLPELRDRMREGISDRGYRISAAFIDRWAAEVGAEGVDSDALAVLLIGSLINLRRSTWTFGSAPLGVDDDRIVDTFVALSTSVLDRLASTV